MYCSTCGSRVMDGRTSCETCGAAVAPAAGYGVAAAAMRATVPMEVPVCPRCGTANTGVSYFSQAGPLAGMLALAVMTLPFFGAGGILFYLLRHTHRVCARCGENWGRKGERQAALNPGVQGAALGRGATPPLGPVAEDLPEPKVRFAASIILAMFAMMMIMVGIVEFAPIAGMFGVMSGVGSLMAYNRSRTAREERREAILRGLQQPVLRLAASRGGLLTVTDVASSLGWTLPRAEKVLNSLEDGLRIVSDVTDDGVIVYDFREVRHAARLAAPAPANTVLGAIRAPMPDATSIDRTLHA